MFAAEKLLTYQNTFQRTTCDSMGLCDYAAYLRLHVLDIVWSVARAYVV